MGTVADISGKARKLPDLPEAMWELSPKLKSKKISGETAQKLHKAVLARLRQEAGMKPTFGLVEDMMLERAAAYYIFVRINEEAGIGDGDPLKHNEDGFVDEEAYKKSLQILTAMLSTMQKASVNAPDADEIKQQAVDDVLKVVYEAVDTLPQEMQDPARAAIRLEVASLEI